jgi:NAD(P)-dependent dehydrogenase (short-subunit alcohol dehydrogenase family)
MDLGLTGRRAVVTGGSRGIGAATATLLRAEGAHVAVIGRDVDALAAVAAATGAHAVAADLANAAGVERGIDEALDALGGVDILVNNAGASTTGSFDEITDEQWYAAFDLKVMGYVRCMRAVLPTMRAQHFGRIVNVGGTAGIRATPGYTLAALNAALVHLTRSTAELVGRDGITVTSLHPGPTLTDRLRTLLGRAAEQSGTDVEAFANEVIGTSLPLGRVGSAEEVAAMIVVLCSELAGWVTGGGLTIDGGAAQGLVGG